MNKRGILIKTAAMVLLATIISGCVLTKIVTVPMRVVGAIVSIIPVAGNTANKAIQTASDAVDDVPI